MRRLAIATLAVLCAAAVTPAAQVRVGDAAPAVTIADWTGRSRTLDEFRGTVVAVDFWATWCTVCRQALPALDALATKHAGAGLRVLAVDVDRSRATADAFLAQQLPSPALTLLHDPGGAVMARFGAEGMPALFVLDREGTVRLVEAGYAPDAIDRIEARVVELLRAPAVTPDAAVAR